MAICRRRRMWRSPPPSIARGSCCRRSTRRGRRQDSRPRASCPCDCCRAQPIQARPWVSQWLSTLPAEPRSASLTARVTEITPAMLRPFVTPDTIREVEGKMALSITAEADALALERVRASAVLDEAAAHAGRRSVQTGGSHETAARGRLRIDRRSALGFARQRHPRVRRREHRRGSASGRCRRYRGARSASPRSVCNRHRHGRDGAGRLHREGSTSVARHRGSASV